MWLMIYILCEDMFYVCLVFCVLSVDVAILIKNSFKFGTDIIYHFSVDVPLRI